MDGIKKKILIADDDPSFVLLVSRHLESKGYDILKCVDGSEAFHRIKKEMPDLVILDHMMPKMEGVKICALLKVDKRYCKIPIISITASAEDAIRKLSEEARVDVFLNKPIDLKELDKRIDELLGR